MPYHLRLKKYTAWGGIRQALFSGTAGLGESYLARFLEEQGNGCDLVAEGNPPAGGMEVGSLSGYIVCK